MAILQLGNKQVEVQDGEPIINAAKELGILFGCEHGMCGTCDIEVREGMENLSGKTPQEENLGCEGKARQACQCTIMQGMVVINQ